MEGLAQPDVSPCIFGVSNVTVNAPKINMIKKCLTVSPAANRIFKSPMKTFRMWCDLHESVPLNLMASASSTSDRKALVGGMIPVPSDDAIDPRVVSDALREIYED